MTVILMLICSILKWPVIRAQLCWKRKCQAECLSHFRSSHGGSLMAAVPHESPAHLPLSLFQPWDKVWGPQGESLQKPRSKAPHF